MKVKNKKLLLELLNENVIEDIILEKKLFRKPTLTFVVKTVETIPEFHIEIEITEDDKVKLRTL